MNDLYNISMLDLLPPSMVRDVNVIDTSQIIDSYMKKLNQKITQLIILPNIDNLDHELLDLLAIQFTPPFYDISLNIDIKRNLIKNSINWHKTKGTVAALEEVVNTIFGGDSEIVEWYEYGGEPHHFKIITTHIGTDDTLIEEFKKVAESIKRKSSVLEEVVVLLTNKFNIYYGFALQIGDDLKLRQEG